MLHRIGKYEVQSEIGEGGFGRVYLAHDPSVDRQVAIKILNAQPDPDMLRQFRAEAKTTGNLRHKNIVTVYDFGEYQGVPFLVMELLEGQNLEEAIRARKKMSLTEKLDLLHQTAEGLHHAHQMGVIHRDVKPANIMLLPGGSIKIMDFGIANFVNPSTTSRAKRNDLTGTTRYMAPEQFTGTPADVQTDVFSFGLVCYECISGAHPFESDGESRIMYRIATAQAEPLDRVCEECPESLAAAVHRALALDREVRYQSLDDFLLDFQPILLEVRRKQALALMAVVDSLEEAESEKARVILKQVLEFDPSHETARRMLEKLRADERRLALVRSIEERLLQGAARVEARDYSGAIASFEGALRGDSSCEEARIGLENARRLLESSRSCARLLSSARQEAMTGATSRALDLLEEALALDAGNQPALEFRRKLKVSVAVRESQVLRSEKNFDCAETMLRDLHEFSQDAEVQSELATVRRERDLETQERRRKDFESRRLSVEKERVAGDLATALQIAQDARGSFPEHENELLDVIWGIREEQAAAKRANAIQGVITAANGWLAEGSFSLAIEALESALKLYPRERKLLELNTQVRARLLESQIAESIRAGQSALQVARESGRWEDALKHLAFSCQSYPQVNELESMRAEAETELREREALVEWQGIQSRAREMMISAPAEAVSHLTAAAAKHGGRIEYAALLETARTEADFRDRLTEIRSHMEKRNWRKAGASLESAAAVHAERPEFDDLTREIAAGQKADRITDALARVRQLIEQSKFVSARESLLRMAGLSEYEEPRAILEKELAIREAGTLSSSCSKCGAASPAAAKFCDNCGTRILVSKMSDGAKLY